MPAGGWGLQVGRNVEERWRTRVLNPVLGQPWQGPGLWAGLAPGDGLGRWMQSQSQSQGQGQTRSQPPPMPRGWGSRPDDGGAGNEPLINQLEVRGRSTSDGCMPGGS